MGSLCDLNRSLWPIHLGMLQHKRTDMLILKDKIKAIYSFFCPRYNFVTPLTSLVVIRPKDLKRIEAELKKEEEARAKKEEEERKRLEEEEKERERLEEETAKKSFEHSRLFHAVSRKISEDVPSADLSYSGGFYGDPHFLIPIRQNLNLCFNWDGNEGSVSSILLPCLRCILL